MTYCDTQSVTSSLNIYSSMPYICILLLQNNKDWYLFVCLIYIWYVSVNSE